MGCLLNYSNDDLAFLELLAQAEARSSFWAFRQYMRPKMKVGWWQREVAEELQQFYEAFVAGRRPVLLIQAPPQHGKSEQIVDFIAWLAGQIPDTKAIYASFSERLGVRANLALQRMYDSPRYRAVFPDTHIARRNSVAVSGQTLRNRDILEYVGRAGFFRNTTVRGPVTGEGLDLGILDDPIKGREDANSARIRDKTWDWLTDDFMSRFSDHAGLLGIMTRWHVDDPFGRLAANNPNAKVLRYPALAEVDEPHRRAGEPLFPEHKSLEFLLERKKAMRPENFSALYQQSPYVTGGNIIKTDKFEYYTVLPPLVWRKIYVDTAQKIKKQNDWTVFACWGKDARGNAFLVDLRRGKFEAPELLVEARAFWAKHLNVTGHGRLRSMNVEDKVSGTGLIQTLKRGEPGKHPAIPTKAVQRSTDKVERAQDIAPSIDAGLVYLPADAPWLSDFLAEHGQFPNGAHDDQVDTTVDAVEDICLSGIKSSGKSAGTW